MVSNRDVVPVCKWVVYVHDMSACTAAQKACVDVNGSMDNKKMVAGVTI